MCNFCKPGFDPGHYANANMGPGSYREGNVMLQFGLALQKAYDVFLTRTDGRNFTLKERARLAKVAGCNTLISIHTNAPIEAINIKVFYSIQRPEDKELAEQLGKQLSKATGIPFKEAKTRSFVKDPNTDYYGIIRESIRQGIKHVFLVEHGSHWEFAVDTETKIKACVEAYGRVLGLEKKMEAKYYVHNNIAKPVIKKGSIGINVKLVQQELNAAGFNCGTADGDFGKKTDKAVRLFQKACGLVQDGIVGDKTWAALLNVHVVELEPGMLKAGLVSSPGRDVAETVKNFINANFFSGKKVIGWLISEGFVLSRRDNHKLCNGKYDYPKGTFIKYKNGQVEVGLKTDGQIAPITDNIQFCCQGFNLLPLDIKKEGFDPDEVGRTCNSLMMGYNETTGKVIIAVRKCTNAARAAATMREFGCPGAIRLDSGGSTNLWIDSKAIFQTSRALANIIYW